MDRESFLNRLKALSIAKGISGQEQAVVRVILDMLNGYPDVQTDSFGNITVKVSGSGRAPSLMLTAHTDEVGAVVNAVMPNGLLSFKTVGYVNIAALPSTRVRVNELPGTITTAPAHMAASDSKRVWETYIDIGAESAEDALSMGVRIGDPVCFDTDFTLMGANRVCSRVIDDRVGCAVLLEVLFSLNTAPPGDVYFTFSVREETTMSGAGMLAQRIKPDCAIAIDTVPVDDTHAPNPQLRIGGGPVLQLIEGVMQAYVGNSVHPGLKKLLVNTAEDIGIQYQTCAEVGIWTTDGAAIHEANAGVPTGYISIPRRYAHSASEVLDIRDALTAVSFVRAICCAMGGADLSFI